MPDWPQNLHPVRPDRRGDALVLDEDASPAEVFQLQAGNATALLGWLDTRGFPATRFNANGGPVVVLPGEPGGVVGLGDYAVLQDGRLSSLAGGLLHNTFQPEPPVEEPEPPEPAAAPEES